MISMMYTAFGLPPKKPTAFNWDLDIWSRLPPNTHGGGSGENHALTGIANRTFQCSYSDLHTGARIYSREFLIHLPWDKLSDDFVFDHQLLSILWHKESLSSSSQSPQITVRMSQAFLSSIGPVWCRMSSQFVGCKTRKILSRHSKALLSTVLTSGMHSTSHNVAQPNGSRLR